MFRKSNTVSASPDIDAIDFELSNNTAQLIDLTIDRLQESLALERAAHKTPWSESLIRDEFLNEISLRPALLLDGELVAQSFNYFVVDELHILNIAVNPKHRRQGYAKFLLQHTLDVAKQRGGRIATLEVRESNKPAQQLYRRFNFTVIGSRPNYYKDNGENALIFERLL